jgi:nucleoside-diphosphate-sugar epimerase
VKAARIDTIVHTFLVVDSTMMRSRTMHEINVIGTMNLFAAASAVGSTVRNVVVKSSTLVYGTDAKDPVWFTEESRRAKAPRSMLERSLLEVEGYVRDFAVEILDNVLAVNRPQGIGRRRWRGIHGHSGGGTFGRRRELEKGSQHEVGSGLNVVPRSPLRR